MAKLKEEEPRQRRGSRQPQWRRRCSLALSLFLAFSVLASSRGCLSDQQQQVEQQHGPEPPATTTAAAAAAATAEHRHKHHDIFSSSPENRTRKNRHPRVPPRRDACDPLSVPPHERCKYVTEQRSCEAAGGRVPYTRLWFCLVFGDDGEEAGGGGGAGAVLAPPALAGGENSSSSPSSSSSSSSSSPQQQQQQQPQARTFSLPAAALLLLGALLWAACLFSVLAVVSSKFLAPAVSWVATALRVPPALAGVTLLAFAGGAPDLATEIAAVLSRDYGGFGSSDGFEAANEDGTPAPPLSPAERAAMLRDANAIVADDLGMGLAVALGSSLATLCCGLAAIGWFARSSSGGSSAAVGAVAGGGGERSRTTRRGRTSRWPPRRDSNGGDADVENESDDVGSNSSPSPVSTASSNQSSGIAVEDRRAFARDVVAYSVALFALGAALFDGTLGLWESLALLLVYLIYIAASVWGSRVVESRERAEEERAEAAEEGMGVEVDDEKKRAATAASGSSSPRSIEMAALTSSPPPPPPPPSALLLQLPPRSPVPSPFRNQQQEQGGAGRANNGNGAFAFAVAAAFPLRAVAAPQRKASTEVGDVSSNPNTISSNFQVVATPPTPAGGFGAVLRNILGGNAGGGGGGGGEGDASSSRTPLLLPPPSSPLPPELSAAAFTSAFSEPLTDGSGVPFLAALQQQQRNRSRSPVGRLSSQLTRLPRRLSSTGVEQGQPEVGTETETASAATTGFSLSPNAALPLALEMTTTVEAAAAAVTEQAEGGDAAHPPRARKGLGRNRLLSSPSPSLSKRELLASAVLSKADDLLPSVFSQKLHASVRLLLAALIAPVAAALHCTMPAFGEEEEEGGGGGEGMASKSAVEAATTAKETAAPAPAPALAAPARAAAAPAVQPPPPSLPPPEIPLLTLARAAVLCFCAPLAAASLLGVTPTAAGGWLLFALSATGGSCALALAFSPYFWRNRGQPVPLRCAASAALALALSGAWLAAAADEAVDLARAFARAARLPSELAGGLLLGAGEALPDVAATAALARAAARASGVAAAAAVAAAATAAAAAGASSSSSAAAAARARAAAAAAKAAEAPARIALGATFGAPVFNLLVGLPLPAAIAALKSGWSDGGGGDGSNPNDPNSSSLEPHRVSLPARLTNGALALGIASVVALALLAVALPCRWCRWRVGRAVAAGAAAFWVSALAVFALVEVGAVGSGREAVPSAREVVVKP